MATQQTKTCGQCNIDKILKDFTPSHMCHLRVRQICKKCNNKNQNQVKRAKKECLKLGFDLRVCMVCKKKAKIGRRNHCVDHNHDTGEFRLVLCCVCNLSRGGLGEHIPNIRAWCDKAEIAEAAVKLLRLKAKSTPTQPTFWDYCVERLGRYAYRP